MNKGVLVIGILVLFLGGGVSAYLTDSLSHPPPSSGTYSWDNFRPGDAAFPGEGETYVEPIFDEIIRRITNRYDGNNYGWKGEYSAQKIVNSDGTKILVWDYITGDYYFSDAINGGILRLSPNSANKQWHPTDPDKLLYFSGSSIMEYRYSSDNSVVVHDFGGNINNYGEADFIDNTGRYYVALRGNTLVFYDKAEDVEYSNSPTGINPGNGGIYIAPDGSGVVVSDGFRFWYSVNHAENRWNSGRIQLTGVSEGSAHSDVISASDGNTYLVVSGSNNYPVGQTGEWGPYVYIINVNDPSEWRRKQLANHWGSFHISCNVVSGLARDWCAMEVQVSGSSPPSSPFEGEILIFNILNASLHHRLAHHRSVSSGDNYGEQPTATISSDGEFVVFTSNFGRTNNDYYADVYTVTTGFTNSTCSPADTSGNSIIEIGELLTYISQWKSGSVSIGDLLTAIGEWKNGC